VTELGFSGEIAGRYYRYRRGYPPEVIDALAGEPGLTADDVAVDLGCGTGQLAAPPHAPFTEQVPVRMPLGRPPTAGR
jgi:hypothetical protein